MDAKAIGFAPGYYPQVVGIDEGGTDTLAGGTARLFIKGISKWEIVFLTADEAPVEPPGRRWSRPINLHSIVGYLDDTSPCPAFSVSAKRSPQGGIASGSRDPQKGH